MAHGVDFAQQFDLAPTLAALPGNMRFAMDRVASLGFRYVQLSATHPGLRPRELDGTARRDLIATLRRRELAIAGIDLWVPPSHFADTAHVDRAVSASIAAIRMAGDLGRRPVSMTLPAEVDDDVAADAIRAIVDAAHRCGAPIADHQTPVANRQGNELLGIGIDPASWLAAGLDPVQGVRQQSDCLVSTRLSDLLTTGLRGPIGTRDGRLDVTEYQVSLSIAGYNRPVVLDARQWPDPWASIESSAEHWRSITP